MKIRRGQMEMLEDASRGRFLDFMDAHVREHFPDHAAALGPEGIRRACEAGIDRAAEHGMVSERDVCKFTSLMFAFGESFDSDPRYPWAAEVLADPEIRNPSTRADALTEKAQAYLAWLRKKAGQ